MKNNDVSLAGTPFPIVGIGASVGGLVALEQLLPHMPPNSGMAFVVVQHLDPHREGMPVELLQRRTIMPVVEAQDQMRVEPDHVYVIPPGSDLAVLQTVNHELQAKVTELSRASNDMKNLLDSTEIATLFLDETLNVRRFTAQTTRLFKLIPGDTGRPISNIVTELSYPEMAQDAREVLRTLVFRERDVAATDGRWFKVRTMPYRTQENRIDGVVITFSDISVAKRLEAELRATQARLSELLETSKLQGVGNGLS